MTKVKEERWLQESDSIEKSMGGSRTREKWKILAEMRKNTQE